MPANQDRFGGATCKLHDDWRLNYVIPPSRLFGANGIQAGADGRIYVAQLSGSQISTIDPDSGRIEHLENTGSDIVGPDDLAFDGEGNLFITEYTENRVSMRHPNGATQILQGNLPGANPITFGQGHLIAGECRPDARIVELNRNGGEPRLILDQVPMTNAFEIGPDSKLYFPVMMTNEIWRVNLDGSGCEVVAGGLGVPDSVKFDRNGFIISTQVGSGQVLRIDPANGQREVLADIGPGLDNCAFVGDRLFVSHMTGSIHEILAPGKLRALNEKGLLWPMGIAASPDGTIYAADGSYAYAGRPDGKIPLIGMLFTPGYPGFHRGVAAAGSGEWLVTTSLGEVKTYRPAAQESTTLANGYDRLMGIARAPDGRIIFAESGAGRVWSLYGDEVTELAAGLDAPSGVAIAADGTCYIAENGRGRVIALKGGKSTTVIDGLKSAEGLTEHNGKIYVIDVLGRELVQAGTDGKNRSVIISELPVGARSGVRKYLGPAGSFSGPMISFAGLAAGPDGTLYLGADGNGSVMAVRPAGA